MSVPSTKYTSPPPKTPTLFVECLGHVLSYLRNNQLPTLVSLLRVNSTLFHLTVPLLYRNPFHFVINHRSWTPEQKEERLVLLLKLFLSELDPSLREQLPPIAQREEDEEEEWDESIDGHLAQLQKKNPANLCEIDTKEESVLPVLHRGEGGVRKYFYHYRMQDHSLLARRTIPTVFGGRNHVSVLDTTALFKTASSANRINVDKNNLDQDKTKIVQQRVDKDQTILSKLDQLFMLHCDFRLLSLRLSASRVHQFREALPFLSKLQVLDIQHIQFLEKNEKKIDELVDWIQTHDRTFGTLRELALGGLTEFELDDGESSELVRIPLAFKKLTVLDTRSWTAAWSMIDKVHVEDLERLSIDFEEGEGSNNGSQLLTRCKNLKVLDILVPGPDTFSNIVDLFMHRMEVPGVNFPTAPTASYDTLADRWTAPPCLPPIERLYICGGHDNLLYAIEGAVIGLSQSLRVLKATSIERRSVQKSTMTFGSPLLPNLYMPFLHELLLQWDIALEFRFDSLQYCPNLVTLRLMVNGLESCGRSGNSKDPILNLPKLQTLQLMGRWPLTRAFIDQIPKKLTGLKILDLERCFGVELSEVMESVHTMEFLWRVGWAFESEKEEQGKEVIKYWSQRAPQIRVGSIETGEFSS
ncbi:hypothetical protein BGZ83_011721 [Gryganskiella cystojenkinii]|nr:hypothetical protein BGZ83_011721 [Gryganskiella cystojenkinii]